MATDTAKKLNISADSLTELATGFAQAVRQAGQAGMTVEESKDNKERVRGHYILWSLGKKSGEESLIPGERFAMKAGALGEKIPSHVSVTVCFHKLLDPAEYRDYHTKRAATLVDRIESAKRELARLEALK